MNNTTYYQRSRDIALNKENMEQIDIIICLKKRSKNWTNTKENIKKQKIINKILVVNNRVTWGILLSTTTNNIVCIIF